MAATFTRRMLLAAAFALPGAGAFAQGIENRLVIVTSFSKELTAPYAAAFEKKYPGIKVRATRANATEVAVKILNESRAGRVQSDVFDGTTTVVPLKKEGFVL